MNNILGRHTGIRADTQGIGADTRVCPYGNTLNRTTVWAHTGALANQLHTQKKAAAPCGRRCKLYKGN